MNCLVVIAKFGQEEDIACTGNKKHSCLYCGKSTGFYSIIFGCFICSKKCLSKIEEDFEKESITKCCDCSDCDCESEDSSENYVDWKKQ